MLPAQLENYLLKHPYYNGVIHFLGGIGVGILVTYPLIGSHPVRWGGVFLTLGILGHLYPLLVSKKKGRR